jgi:2-methylcitrate dehydratase PrpD
MHEHLDALAEFACRRDLDRFDPAAVERARWVILDSLVAMAHGLRVPEMQALLRSTLASAAPGPCWVVGAGRRTNAGDAALLNGTSGTWLELNEGCLIAKGHPGIQVVPLAVALAQELDAPGETLLRAILMGYEVSSRVGRGARLRVAVHPHGTYGAIGAAVAAAVLKGFEVDRMKEVIRVASTLGLATSRRTLLEGATVRNVYTGHSGTMGLLAARLVEAGFTGESAGVQSVFGQVVGEEFDSDSLSAGLGSDWLIKGGYFKLHPTGRYVHAAIDALEAALAQAPDGLDPAAVERIAVRTFKLGSMLDGQAITTSFGARFSIPFALATRLVHGTTSLAAFSDEAVANPHVQALARRIDVREDPAFTARYPAEQATEAVIRMADGRTLTGQCDVMKGEAANPYRNGEVERKFLDLGTQAWGADAAGMLRDRILRIEQFATTGALLAGLVL